MEEYARRERKQAEVEAAKAALRRKRNRRQEEEEGEEEEEKEQEVVAQLLHAASRALLKRALTFLFIYYGPFLFIGILVPIGRWIGWVGGWVGGWMDWSNEIECSLLVLLIHSTLRPSTHPPTSPIRHERLSSSSRYPRPLLPGLYSGQPCPPIHHPPTHPPNP